jgi:hypothetical protein
MQTGGRIHYARDGGHEQPVEAWHHFGVMVEKHADGQRRSVFVSALQPHGKNIETFVFHNVDHSPDLDVMSRYIFPVREIVGAYAACVYLIGEYELGQTERLRKYVDFVPEPDALFAPINMLWAVYCASTIGEQGEPK